MTQGIPKASADNPASRTSTKLQPIILNVQTGVLSSVLEVLGVCVWKGILPGILFGVVMSVALFAVTYRRLSSIKSELTGREHAGHIERAPEIREILDRDGDRILILRLQGVIFFGTAGDLMNIIRARLAPADRPSPEYLVLDIQHFDLIDASGIRSFSRLAQITESHGVSVVVTGHRGKMRRQLEGIGFFTESEAATPVRRLQLSQLMATFGTPHPRPDDATRALEAALEMVAAARSPGAAAGRDASPRPKAGGVLRLCAVGGHPLPALRCTGFSLRCSASSQHEESPRHDLISYKAQLRNCRPLEARALQVIRRHDVRQRANRTFRPLLKPRKTPGKPAPRPRLLFFREPIGARGRESVEHCAKA